MSNSRTYKWVFGDEVRTGSGSDRVLSDEVRAIGYRLRDSSCKFHYLIARLKSFLMWNDTDVALAVLITFRCYGTWLHGDERGSVDRFQNRFRSPYIKPNKQWHEHNASTLKGESVILDSRRRRSVEDAIRQTCVFRGWFLHAVNVRTNHAHTVVSIGTTKPERALAAFKANATRQMRQDGCWSHEHSPWVPKGSKRRLWNERSVARAIEYVLYGQGDELPDFDD